MSTGKLRVLVGPYRNAARYAERHGWAQDSFIIVTRHHELHGLDPARIASIVLVRLHALGERIAREIREEIMIIRALWPMPMKAEI